MARKMGRMDVAATFEKRAAYWRNSFDAKTGWLRARKADGSFRVPFDPTAINYGSDYTEGNAWQYSWFVPQDQGGLFSMLGGDAATVAKLDAMFDFDNSKVDYSHAEDIAGLIGQYIHGNEPSHHVAYLYAFAGAPWRTQARLKQIVDSQYNDTEKGLSGNDDIGQMSAWLVFTEPGFLPRRAGQRAVCDRPAVRRPRDDQAAQRQALHDRRRRDERRQHLCRRGHAQRQAARPASTSPMTRSSAAATLRFTMSATPNKAWGTSIAARPYSMSGY